eukprot:Hpha_TRINITY_DN15979_c4_g9::TRINITY_DN15979_c4_g9_i1::g.73403::m.73403
MRKSIRSEGRERALLAEERGLGVCPPPPCSFWETTFIRRSERSAALHQRTASSIFPSWVRSAPMLSMVSGDTTPPPATDRSIAAAFARHRAAAAPLPCARFTHAVFERVAARTFSRSFCDGKAHTRTEPSSSPRVAVSAIVRRRSAAGRCGTAPRDRSRAVEFSCPTKSTLFCWNASSFGTGPSFAPSCSFAQQLLTPSTSTFAASSTSPSDGRRAASSSSSSSSLSTLVAGEEHRHVSDARASWSNLIPSANNDNCCVRASGDNPGRGEDAPERGLPESPKFGITPQPPFLISAKKYRN